MSGSTLDLTGYHMTFDDEFNSFSSSPTGSSTQWATTAFGLRTLSANAEQEYYSDPSVGVNPFSDQNGVLTITASPGSNPLGLPYNSGEISSSAMFSQSTGYFEMRAELPSGQGMWPAFWLMPENSTPGEIDALEAFGSAASDGEGGADTYHWGMHAGNAAQNGGNWVPTGSDITAGYHTYGVDVETDKTTYYFDGQEAAQIATPDGLGSTPLYMIANLAAGGSWPGDPNGESAQMNIDYIRAYSKDPNVSAAGSPPSSSADGTGTSTTATATAGSSPTSANPAPTQASAAASSPSDSDTVVTAGSGQAITDGSGNQWTITSGGQVAVNGTTDPATHSVTELASVGGKVWQENSWNQWYSKSSPTGSWSAGTSTSPLTSPLPTGTASASDTTTVSQSNISVAATSGAGMVFVGGSNDVADLSAGSSTVTDTGGGNTYVLPAAGTGTATFTSDILSAGDTLDLKSALAATDWDGAVSTLPNYLSVSDSSQGAVVSIAPHSGGSGTAIATIAGATNLDLNAVLAHSIT